jgi:hypothetical protein
MLRPTEGPQQRGTRLKWRAPTLRVDTVMTAPTSVVLMAR